jgi:hypothetical protein
MSLIEAPPIVLYGILRAFVEHDLTFQPARAVLNLAETSKYLNLIVRTWAHHHPQAAQCRRDMETLRLFLAEGNRLAETKTSSPPDPSSRNFFHFFVRRLGRICTLCENKAQYEDEIFTGLRVCHLCDRAYFPKMSTRYAEQIFDLEKLQWLPTKTIQVGDEEEEIYDLSGAEFPPPQGPASLVEPSSPDEVLQEWFWRDCCLIAKIAPRSFEDFNPLESEMVLFQVFRYLFDPRPCLPSRPDGFDEDFVAALRIWTSTTVNFAGRPWAVANMLDEFLTLTKHPLSSEQPRRERLAHNFSTRSQLWRFFLREFGALALAMEWIWTEMMTLDLKRYLEIERYCICFREIRDGWEEDFCFLLGREVGRVDAGVIATGTEDDGLLELFEAEVEESQGVKRVLLVQVRGSEFIQTEGSEIVQMTDQ